MAYQEPFGYIILERQDHPDEISNVEVTDKPHLFYVRFDTILQSLDCDNRNRRNYNGDALVKGLSTSELMELMANNKWKGERDHPISKDIARISTVLSKFESHRIIKWWREDNLIKGTIETLDDGLFGTALTKNILQGEVPSFSLRGLAMLEKKGNITYVNKPPKVITYDEVNLPSHKEAYAIKSSNELMTTNGFEQMTMENVTAEDIKSITESNGAIPIRADDIKDLLVSRSDNLKIVCESFDIDPDTVKIMSNGRQLSVRRNGQTMVFALENKLMKDVSEYMASIF